MNPFYAVRTQDAGHISIEYYQIADDLLQEGNTPNEVAELLCTEIGIIKAKAVVAYECIGKGYGYDIRYKDD